MSDLYKKFLRPLIFKLEAENAHELVCHLLSYAENFPILRKAVEVMVSCPQQECSILGLKFPIVGLAAGFDKNGCFRGICSALGFGHVEVGRYSKTATRQPQTGLLRLVKRLYS